MGEIRQTDKILPPIFEEIKNWRIKRLREMYFKRLNAYDNSKLKARPYFERKEIFEQMKILEAMAAETKKIKLLPAITWLEREDIKEMPDLSLLELNDENSEKLKKFVKFNFERIVC